MVIRFSYVINVYKVRPHNYDHQFKGANVHPEATEAT